MQTGPVTWAFLREALPFFVIAAGIAWALIELRMRKILDHRDEKLRSERSGVAEDTRKERKSEIDEIRRHIEDVADDVRRDIDPERRLTDLEERLDEAERRVEALTTRTGTLETKVDVFWRAIEQYVPKVFRGGGL